MVALGSRTFGSAVHRHGELSRSAVNWRYDQVEAQLRCPADRRHSRRVVIEMLSDCAHNVHTHRMNRQEALDEYYKVAAFVQAYDGYFLNVKAWGVTVTAGAI